MTDDVCVVIVTHRAGRELETVVRRIREQGARVLCVDTASGDDTVARAVEAGADVLPLEQNVGYGSAFNAGLAQTTEAIVICSNQDLLVARGAIARLRSQALATQDLVLAAPRLETSDGQIAETAHLLPRPVRHQKELLYGGGGLRNVWPKEDPEWVSGAFLAARRETWNELDGFDDAYWMYVEDVDLFARLRKRGGRLVYDTGAVVTHLGGRRPLAAEMHAEVLQNWMLYYRAHHGPLSAAVAALAAVVGGLGRGAAHLVLRTTGPERYAYSDMFYRGVVIFVLNRGRRP